MNNMQHKILIENGTIYKSNTNTRTLKKKRFDRDGTKWESSGIFCAIFSTLLLWEKNAESVKRNVGWGHDEGSRFDWSGRGGAVTSRTHNRPRRAVMAAVYQERALVLHLGFIRSVAALTRSDSWVHSW